MILSSGFDEFVNALISYEVVPNFTLGKDWVRKFGCALTPAQDLLGGEVGKPTGTNSPES